MKRLLTATFALVLCATPAFAQTYAPIPKVLNGLTNTATVVKAGPGVVQWLVCYNPNAAAAYVQMYDTTGSVTVGTTPPSDIMPVTGQQTVVLTGAANFFNGIKAAATTTATGGTAPSTALDCAAGLF